MCLESAVFGAIVARFGGEGRRIIGCRMTLVTTLQGSDVTQCVAAGDSPARVSPARRYNYPLSCTRSGPRSQRLFLLLARALKLPEFYWAPISTIVILLAPSDPLTLAWQRFAGTALGAVVGALIASFLPMDWWVYGAGIVVCGLLSGVLRQLLIRGKLMHVSLELGWIWLIWPLTKRVRCLTMSQQQNFAREILILDGFAGTKCSSRRFNSRQLRKSPSRSRHCSTTRVAGGVASRRAHD